jgi:hypothetical protein
MTLTQTPTDELQDEFDQWDTTARLDQLYTMAKDAKHRRHAEWARNYMLTFSRSTGSNTRPGSGIKDSEIYPIIRNRIAWMTDQKMDFQVNPAVDPFSEFADHERAISRHMDQILASNYSVQGWYRQITLLLWDSALCGAGILKSVWDSGLDGGLGNVSLQRRDPWKIYPDPDATSMDDLSYIFEVNRMSLEELERRFPNTAAAVIEEAFLTGDKGDLSVRPRANTGMENRMVVPGNIPGNQGTPWGRPGQGVQTASDQVLQDGVNVYECWIRENVIEDRRTTDPLLGEEETVVKDEWRVIVYTGRHVLFDSTASNLWQHNHHPYSRYVDDETGEFWPVPLVTYLAPAQIAIDRLLAAMQSNAELTGNPIFMDVANSGLGRTQVVNRAGLRLTMDASVANTNGAKPAWMPPPQMSGDVLPLINMWRQIMENISGLSQPQKGQLASGRQAAQTMQSAQEAGFVSIRGSLRNLEIAMARAGTLLVHLIAQNYTVPRTMAIVGNKGTSTSLLLAARHFYSPSRDMETGKYEMTPLVFSLTVSTGSDRPTSRQARIAEADALFAMHAVDQQYVLQAHEVDDWQGVVQRMTQQAMAMAAAGAQAGKTPGGKPQPKGPGTGHPH